MTFTTFAAVLGWVGTAAALLAYVLVSLGRVPGEGPVFQTLNVVAGAGLGIAAIGGRVWSAATLNAVWVVVGLIALARWARRRPQPQLGSAP